MSDATARDGYIFVCLACGKPSHTKYGFEAPGWDESCMLNSIELRISGITDPVDWQYPQRIKAAKQ